MRKLFLLILCLSLTACSLSQAKPQDDINNQAATLVAMTLNAFSHTPAPTNTPLPSPTRSATGTPTPTITPTYATPILKINEATTPGELAKSMGIKAGEVLGVLMRLGVK